MSVQDAIKAAQGAGFEGDDLIEIVAISRLESGWRADATNDTRRFRLRDASGIWRDPNTDETLPMGVGPEYSVGPLQINLHYWDNVAEWEARWWPTAFAWAYNVFRLDRGFGAWSAAASVTEAERNVVRHALTQPIAHPVETPSADGGLDLDALQSTRMLQALWQLVAQGGRLSVYALGEGDVLSISADVKRADLLATGVPLVDFLP